MCDLYFERKCGPTSLRSCRNRSSHNYLQQHELCMKLFLSWPSIHIYIFNPLSYIFCFLHFVCTLPENGHGGLRRMLLYIKLEPTLLSGKEAWAHASLTSNPPHQYGTFKKHFEYTSLTLSCDVFFFLFRCIIIVIKHFYFWLHIWKYILKEVAGHVKEAEGFKKEYIVSVS